MITTHKTMTLGDLIDALRIADDDIVRGLTPHIDSYRGYYERNAIKPDENFEMKASDLADAYEQQIGKAIRGWKGGDYVVKKAENVYFADQGDLGPNICGLVPAGDGTLVPLLVEVNEW